MKVLHFPLTRIVLATLFVLVSVIVVLGIIIGWDMAVDGIFGVGHSGLTGSSIQGLVQAKLSGRVLITGGASGVEASLIAVAILLMISIVLLRMSVTRGNIVSPFWRRSKETSTIKQNITGLS